MKTVATQHYENRNKSRFNNNNLLKYIPNSCNRFVDIHNKHHVYLDKINKKVIGVIENGQFVILTIVPCSIMQFNKQRKERGRFE